MRPLALPIVTGTAAAYLLLDQLWLFAANSQRVSESGRPLLKALCIVVAVALYLATAAVIAIRRENRWVLATTLNAGAAAGFGTVLIIAASALWWRDQFFHDGGVAQRGPALVLLVLAVAICAAVAAAVVGYAARLLWPRRGEKST